MVRSRTAYYVPPERKKYSFTSRSYYYFKKANNIKDMFIDLKVRQLPTDLRRLVRTRLQIDLPIISSRYLDYGQILHAFFWLCDVMFA